MGVGIYILSVIVGAAILFKLWSKFTTGRCTSKRMMKGKTVIITGANSGIGKTTALDLARRGARVILACRNEKLGLEAVDMIRQATNNKAVVFKHLDVSKQSSIRKFVDEINREESRLDVLINNAGSGGNKALVLTEDGVEETLAINYIGPFLLSHLFLDKLKKSAPSRIIHVSSVMHKNGKFLIDERGNHEFHPKSIYSDTKLALNTFSKMFAEKIAGTGVTSNSLHPGVVNTDIFRRLPGPILIIVKLLLWLLCKSPEEGAQTTLHLAVSEEVEGVTGKYFSDCKIIPEDPRCSDKKMAAKLWSLSEKLAKLK